MNHLSGKKQSAEHVAKRMAAMAALREIGNMRIHDQRRAIAWEPESVPRYAGLSACWNCTSHKTDEHGRPKLSRYGKPMRVVTIIFEECFGAVPKGQVIRHKCDNSLCINPEHLILGTQADNCRDASERGRTHLSDRKITNEQALEIRAFRAAGMVFNAIAEKFGITAGHVRDIVNKRVYRYI